MYGDNVSNPIIKKMLIISLSTVLAASTITGCGKTATDTSTETSKEETKGETTENSSEKSTEPKNFEELISNLHPGQSYAYAPISDGEDALLVTSYIFDNGDGVLGTYEATIFVENNGSLEKITTVQSGGTAYPIAVTEDNNLILSMRNSTIKGHVDKATGKFITIEESAVDYMASEDGVYHNYKDDTTEIVEDSSLFDELSDEYQSANVLGFTKAGITDDGIPQLAGAVYAAYKGDDLYNISSFYIFDSDTTGSTQTPDGLSGLPFTYEVNGTDITFSFASADDVSESTFSWDEAAFPILKFAEKDETISLSCLGNASPETFEAQKYYDNDNNLLMQVTKFDEKSLTGDIYREERIRATDVENAKIGDNIFSVNGTQFTAVSFEDVNKEIEYATDEEFKADVLTPSRYSKFLVKGGDDDFYYALEKQDYEELYTVVPMMSEGTVRKLIEKNVTFAIKDNCEITLQKFVKGGPDSGDTLTEEFLLGREFKGDNYPDSMQDVDEYYMTNGMLVWLGAVDGELYNFVQVYVP
ncbi:hypothetical protein SAMN02910384_01652 [Pseudobutyrivibrio sp. ACV-2]|uniref:hypothetical protein n=1 Tax=Pseudobutyrivibrio sp. ACV-2 TaxID=1520801 RepID=UPI000897A7B8|nr:hypothetical protein [Pseudobutyrivibrio sp. ACV-2]SEA49928.1 hypothetical protein SAMN02910384_01652 [Pseudobutyrivibrio sp. ACV-2]